MIKQIKKGPGAGKWADVNSKGIYYLSSLRDTERDATIASLQEKAREYQNKMDAIHRKLEKLGAVDRIDPYGYLA